MKYLLEGQETDRLRFRKINLSDFDDWLEFHKDPLTRVHWKMDYDSPGEECRKWYEKQQFRYENGLGGMNALIEKETGKLVGHCGLLVQPVDGLRELEIGYSLLREFWNRGLATEAAIKCKDFAFENLLAESLISIISLTNTPSQRVALKNGMRMEKTTVYKDNPVRIFRVHLSEWDGHQKDRQR
ncbi:GNAT family N-acetyltransferase [Negadavirga shengliensis]|uniref:GNAT family N-acetyltransferase n=1 Tax=Negadavirga shengliensis TaxID=1389218 RepID=A0ABV9T0X0_9BACT